MKNVKSHYLSHYLAVTSFALYIFVFSCGGDDSTKPDDEITFSADIQSLLSANCTSCHTTGNASAGLSLESWSSLIAGSAQGEVVIPFDPDNSLLIEMLTKLSGGVHPTEVGGTSLGSDDIDKISTWILAGAQNDDGMVPFENASNLLYVCNQKAAIVSVISTDANVVIRNVRLQDLGYTPTAKPHHIAIEPDGSAWYVSLIEESKVLKFNNNLEKVGEASVPIPALLAAHPTNGKLYVSRFMMGVGDIPQEVSVINRADMTVDGVIQVQSPIPHAMAVSSDGNYVYTCSLPNSQIIVINPATGDVDQFISLGSGKGPLQLAISPDNNILYVSTQIAGEMAVIDVSDPNNRQIVKTIAVGGNPWHPVFTPDGSRVYVANFGSNVVNVINTADYSVSAIGDGTGVDGLAQPHGIAMAKDGSRVYVSCRNTPPDGNYVPRHDFGDNANVGTVVVINTASNQIERVLEIEEFGSGMALK